MASGLRDLLARLKLFCDLGALARREESLRDLLGRALEALLAAFPLARRAAIYTSDAASDHLAPIAQRSTPPGAPMTWYMRKPSCAKHCVRKTGIESSTTTHREVLARACACDSLPTACSAAAAPGGDRARRACISTANRAATPGAPPTTNCSSASPACSAWLIATQRGRSPERAIEAHDLALARRIQQRFLPQSPPAIGGYRIAESYSAARVIGGDYFDFFQLPRRPRRHRHRRRLRQIGVRRVVHGAPERAGARARAAYERAERVAVGPESRSSTRNSSRACS